MGGHPPPGLAALPALRPAHDLSGHDRTPVAGRALRGRGRAVHGDGRAGLPPTPAARHPDRALGPRPGDPRVLLTDEPPARVDRHWLAHGTRVEEAHLRSLAPGRGPNHPWSRPWPGTGSARRAAVGGPARRIAPSSHKDADGSFTYPCQAEADRGTDRGTSGRWRQQPPQATLMLYNCSTSRWTATQVFSWIPKKPPTPRLAVGLTWQNRRKQRSLARVCPHEATLYLDCRRSITRLFPGVLIDFPVVRTVRIVAGSPPDARLEVFLAGWFLGLGRRRRHRASRNRLIGAVQVKILILGFVAVFVEALVEVPLAWGLYRGLVTSAWSRCCFCPRSQTKGVCSPHPHLVLGPVV